MGMSIALVGILLVLIGTSLVPNGISLIPAESHLFHHSGVSIVLAGIFVPIEILSFSSESHCFPQEHGIRISMKYINGYV
jgi:hypothetical protein